MIEMHVLIISNFTPNSITEVIESSIVPVKVKNLFL